MGILCGLFLLSGCAAMRHDPAEGNSPKPIITLSDTNRDGMPDVARFHYPECPDADYELLDTDYDGDFDHKVIQGYMLQQQKLETPIPVKQVQAQAAEQ